MKKFVNLRFDSVGRVRDKFLALQVFSNVL